LVYRIVFLAVQTERDVFLYGHVWEKSELLEDKPYIAVLWARTVTIDGYFLTGDTHDAFVGFFEACYESKCRCLSAPGRS